MLSEMSDTQLQAKEYQAVHRWARKTLGKPDYCEHCDSPKGMFEWANKSGGYLREPDDWLRLCRSCHRKYDDAAATRPFLWERTVCKNGHEFTDDNTKIVNIGKGKTAKRCRTCFRVYDREYKRGVYAR